LALDAAGNLIVADAGNQTIRKVTPAGVVTTLAGAPGQAGYADGLGSVARFNGPRAVAVGTDGTIYVADFGNKVIRAINALGQVSTLAGSVGVIGLVDGTGTTAQFMSPLGMALDPLGNILIADGRAIRRCTPGGLVSTVAGSTTGGALDGIGTTAQFSSAAALVAAPDGSIYVVEHGAHTIRKIDSGLAVSTLAGSPGVFGSDDGVGSSARFTSPTGIGLMPSGDLLVTDGTLHLRQVSVSGQVTTTAINGGWQWTTAGSGCSDADFYEPFSVICDTYGRAYIGDRSSISLVENGILTRIAGAREAPGINPGVGASAAFTSPVGVVVNGTGTALVSHGCSYVYKVSSIGIAAPYATGLSGMGNAMSGAPLAMGPDGSVYTGTRGEIRRIATNGSVTVLAGAAWQWGYLDGLGSSARFGMDLFGIAVDPSGNVYVADTDNYRIRKIDNAGNVTTLAGSGTLGWLDGTGTSAQFTAPRGLAWDASTGTLVVADGGGGGYISNAGSMDYYAGGLRRVALDGTVTTWPGTVNMVTPTRYGTVGLVIDPVGNAIVTDPNGINKFTPGGVKSSVIGVAGQGQNIPGSLFGARIYQPGGIAWTPAGDLIVTTFHGLLQITAP
jgi:sugar lactone lactonase YvrE